MAQADATKAANPKKSGAPKLDLTSDANGKAMLMKMITDSINEHMTKTIATERRQTGPKPQPRQTRSLVLLLPHGSSRRRKTPSKRRSVLPPTSTSGVHITRKMECCTACTARCPTIAMSRNGWKLVTKQLHLCRT
jgi:hypothetical protein